MYSNDEQSDKKKPEPKRCICPNCQGVPVVNGMCLFHFSCDPDRYLKGAMSIVLRNHPGYHRLLNYARLCTHYDPPRTREEWQVVHACAKLLNQIHKLPDGFNFDDNKLFENAMMGYEKIMTDSIRFSPTSIGLELEKWLLDNVMEEARKVMASSKDRESLLSAVDAEELEKRTKYRASDFVEFSRLPMFQKQKREAA